MKRRPIPLIAFCLLFSQFALSQQDSTHRLFLKSGVVVPQKNIDASFVNQFNQKQEIAGQRFVIIQFEHLPGDAQKQVLKLAGIELLDYIPDNAYTASITKNIKKEILDAANARAFVELLPQQKMLPALAAGILPPWAVKVPGTVDVWISFPKTLPFETVSNELKKRNLEIISSGYKNYQVLGLRVASYRLGELASLPFIEYVQPAPREDQPLNFNSRSDSRANALNSSIASGGYDLNGAGVVIGVGDNASPLQHIDISRHTIDRNAIFGGAHGVHVMGTASGSGIIEDKFRGYAPDATMISETFSNIFTNAAAYVQDYNMVITNNSYGNIIGECSYNGLYDLSSRILDQQAFSFPHLENVFAAGNSGADRCPPYLQGFHTVLGGYQAAKNTLDVGNTTFDGTIIEASSKGPVNDGRTKPEISAMGTDVISSWSTNIYAVNTGTSMAAPAVSGGLALLYQRYRQLHANTDPPNALMKAFICNGGTDKGNPGPDFSYGFGWMNLLRSIDMLNNNHYLSSSITTGTLNTHSISVPAGTAQLKLMLYWNDPAANVLASHTLVNDLDLSVTTPSASTLFPGILDFSPANVDRPSTTGSDHVNNIEQVTIDNPAAGTYTINVNGFAVPQNSPQSYYVVYDIIPESTVLTFPTGGEHLLPNDNVIVNWDSYGSPSNPFTIQFSFDNGATWIDSTAPAGARQLAWHVPAIATDQALVRITRNGTGFTSTSHLFTILGAPAVSLAAVQCESYISVNWAAIAGATDYEVLLLRGSDRDMTSMGITTNTSYTISGLSKDTVYWLSVRARINGNPGYKSTAFAVQPNSGSCAGNISDNDLKMDALIAPVSGRQLTSTSLTANTIITARIKNLDDAAVNNFTMIYSVNGGAWNSEPVSATVAAGATYNYSFNTSYDFSAAGIYVLRVAVKNSTVDPVPLNDTMTVVIKQLANPAITLVTGSGFLDNIETATDSTYYNRQIGLEGLDRYDFITSSAYGRVRPFVNSGIAYSGSKAITLDADRPNAGTLDSLTATFNLATHNANTDDIRLDFQFKNHGQDPRAENKVWIRGDDQKPWIEVYDLGLNEDDPGSFKKSASIELSDLLAANSQNFSSSFQVRWGQWGQLLTADNDGGAGYTFDDIHLYKVTDDIQMISIDTPVVVSCGLNATTPVQVTVRNSSNATVTTVPVMYRIDGGAWVSETIGSINANTSVQYLFTTPADLSAVGSHFIETKVAYASDSYPDNDTLSVTLINAPVVTSFPYLENFESGAGSWYSGGKNSSWEYGTPASQKIASAASGMKAWKTRLTGTYSDKEFSYLYSPCFDLTGMTNPTLSLSLALDLEDCGNSLCDAAWVEYSADGITWTKLGTSGSGTNWYNKNYGGNQLWSVQNYTRWHVATTALPLNISRLRLRVVVNADASLDRDGVAIDDIHIYDNIYGIYTGSTMGSPVTQSVSGTGWVDFLEPVTNKLIASVHPNNQNLGSTDVQAYINSGPVRYTSIQYYHDRNITIIPTNYSLTDSAIVRFYYTDAETERLLSATGCSGCTKPASAYELGVSKYTDAANRTSENGTLVDDVTSNWSFITPANAVKVPFDKGYYAEFKIKDFSEFWLNNGYITGSTTLPVKLLSFTASKRPGDVVLLEWKTSQEFNVNRFEVEVARSNSDYQQEHFVKIGEVSSHGNSTTTQQYQFNDAENNKSGVRYYRLKIIDNDGSFHYSEIRPLIFSNNILWQVYPNPSAGTFFLQFQQTAGEPINVKVYDANGKLVLQQQAISDGFIQKMTVDLKPSKFASGMYLIVAEGTKTGNFRVVRL
jgi:hypothetical protein